MGIGILITLVFAVAFLVIYGLMRLSCVLKRKYREAENFIFRALTFFMCASCREACESHTKLLIRAVMFAAVITAVVAITRYIR
jgi:hypothetical protein